MNTGIDPSTGDAPEAHGIAGEPTAEGAAQTTPTAQEASAEAERPRPRTGPIVWGAIVLAFCVYVATQTLAPGSIDATTFLIASVIGLGVLLLVVGAAVLVRNGRNR